MIGLLLLLCLALVDPFQFSLISTWIVNHYVFLLENQGFVADIPAICCSKVTKIADEDEEEEDCTTKLSGFCFNKTVNHFSCI